MLGFPKFSDTNSRLERGKQLSKKKKKGKEESLEMKFHLNEILKRWINMIDIATKRVSFRSTKILFHLMAWKYDDIAMQMIIGLPHGEYKPASSLLPLTID